MSAQILDGKLLAAAVRAEVAARVATLSYKPGLTVVLVGDDPASRVYVKSKDKAATEAGLHARTIRLPDTTTEAELLQVVRDLNDDPEVDGILVQLPLPGALKASEQAVIDALDPAKDVDGLTATNAGRLANNMPGLVPCTPKGSMKLIALAGVPVKGARAVVLGRSVLVGRPVAALLTSADATTTIAHSRTRDLADECRRADILVAAVGRPEMVPGEWIKPGAVVIDVGINRLADGRLVGDVAYEACAAVASAITPVPGGVGPMTIACLLENTVEAAVARRSQASRQG
ncbi:MAG: bifunctional methylenetetrahydrofolate dehydrogenase/methenyltetrahydrofolate cyclohydrolase FolD [Janthinobacterium lividum]